MFFFYNILSKHFMKSSLIATFLGLVAANGAVTTTTSAPLTTTTTKYTTTSSTTGGKSLGGSSYTSSSVSGGGDSRATTSGLISGLLSSSGTGTSGASGSGLRYTSGGYSSGSGYSVGGGAGGYGSGVGFGSATSSSEYGLSGSLGAVVTTTNGPIPSGGVLVSGTGTGGGNVVVVGGQRPPLDQYPKADLNNFYYSTASPVEVNANVNSFRVINQANQNILTPNKSLDSIFIRFPSCSELDRLIISADTVALLKTIQVIATDGTVSCDQRITYLL